MILILNATNRPNNKTQVIARYYAQTLQDKGETVRYYSLEDLPVSALHHDYREESGEVKAWTEEYLLPATRLVVVSPEYNGSFPGVLKLLIDCIPPRHFVGKKAALVGVASGRAGNLRGLDHLTSILHHLGVEVLSKKSYVSLVLNLIQNTELVDETTKQVLDRQMDALLTF